MGVYSDNKNQLDNLLLRTTTLRVAALTRANECVNPIHSINKTKVIVHAGYPDPSAVIS